ncbi:putative splicing factor 3A subunit 1 [Raphanus sativus]|nr:putative splicing factor 3A subunit 1 [Raphanus sativus]
MLSSTQILPLDAPPTDGNLGPLPPSQLTDQEIEERALQSEQNSSNQAPESVATHTRTIGIIHPPPDIRSIVEKTALYVSKNGLDFEKRIIASNAKKEKFNFLTSSDPYHAFYQHKLAEYRAQNEDGATCTDTDGADLKLDSGGDEGEVGEAQLDLQAQFRPPEDLKDKLRKSAADLTTVLERCLHRLEWDQSIDFADDEDEELPPPMTLEEVIRRSKRTWKIMVAM